mgnify:FL=1
MSRTKQFQGMEDDVPEVVQQAADKYKKSLEAKNKAASKANTAKEKCIELMIEHDIDKLKILDGAKVIEFATTPRLKNRKPEELSEEE